MSTLSDFFADFEDEDTGTAMITDADGTQRFVITDAEKAANAEAARHAEMKAKSDESLRRAIAQADDE